MAYSKLENNQTFMGKTSQFKTNLKRKDIMLQNFPVEVSVSHFAWMNRGSPVLVALVQSALVWQ